MKKIRGKVISLILAGAMCLTCIPANIAHAEPAAVSETQNLKDLCGLENILKDPIVLSEQEFETQTGTQNELRQSYYASSKQDYWKSFSSNYYYDQLPVDAKLAWDELEEKCIGYINGESTDSSIMANNQGYLRNYDSADVYNFIIMFKMSHPQFYFLCNSYGYAMGHDSLGNSYYFPAVYVYDKFTDPDVREQATQLFCAKMDAWVATVKQSSNQIEEQEKTAHDLICQNTIYASGEYDQSAYSMVCEGETVCAGYAAALQMLLNASGIDTIEVTSADHAWNMVNLYGVWYEIDATWADQSDIFYNYYNRSYHTYTSESYYGSSHTVEDYWNTYVPEAIYDSQIGYYYETPYFESGNYVWFKVNNDPQSGNGYRAAAPVVAKNGARFSNAPSSVTGSNGESYVTMYLKEDDTAATTAPPTSVTELKIGGRATDALRLNWNKNDTAEGYIIEQYKDGKWTRIARIADNSTTTYRVEKLNASTNYIFRIKAFNFNGTQSQYSDYQYINGKTMPLKLTGVRIEGRSSDAIRINWNKNEQVSGYIIEQYKSGKWVRIARIGNNTTTTYRVENLSNSTTYKFRIQSFDYDEGMPLYSTYVYVDGKTKPLSLTDVRIEGRSSDAIRINWNKNEQVSGYIIEQYKAGKWVRIARIGNNTTTTYRVENLNASTTYKFRVQSFDYDGNIPLYSIYTYIDGKTKPSDMVGMKVGGASRAAIRINWNKNGSAQGYIIEQYKGGKWTRIARIGSNSTTTYRVEKLSSHTTYKFRMQAFSFDGSTPLYGSWSYVNGTTQ